MILIELSIHLTVVTFLKPPQQYKIQFSSAEGSHYNMKSWEYRTRLRSEYYVNRDIWTHIDA